MLPGDGDEPRSIPGVERERLLRVDVLARLERGSGDRRMGERHRQVEHHVDVRVRQQLLGGEHGGHIELRGKRPRAGRIQVGAGDEVQVAQCRSLVA